MSERKGDWRDYRPAKDPYVAARVLEVLPFTSGERGQFAIQMFSYFRWVDNVADECKQLTKEQKLAFLERQRQIIRGEEIPESLHTMEQAFFDMPWDCVPNQEVRKHAEILLDSIVDDVSHEGLFVRSDVDIKEYNLKTITPVVNLLFLVLNGKEATIDHRLMQLLDSYIMIGSMEGLGDDLSFEVLKLPMNGHKGQVSTQEVLSFYDEERFTNLKRKSLLRMLLNVHGFNQLDIPRWQKLACIGYMVADVLVKKPITVRRQKAIRQINI